MRIMRVPSMVVSIRELAADSYEVTLEPWVP